MIDINDPFYNLNKRTHSMNHRKKCKSFVYLSSFWKDSFYWLGYTLSRECIARENTWNIHK